MALFATLGQLAVQWATADRPFEGNIHSAVVTQCVEAIRNAKQVELYYRSGVSASGCPKLASARMQSAQNSLNLIEGNVAAILLVSNGQIADQRMIEEFALTISSTTKALQRPVDVAATMEVRSPQECETIFDYVENPGQARLQHGAIRLAEGGGLFALPIVYEAMRSTVGNNDSQTPSGFEQLDFGKVSGDIAANSRTALDEPMSFVTAEVAKMCNRALSYLPRVS